MTSPLKNIPASIRARLYNLSKKTGQSFNDVLALYGMERLLYRLTQSPYSADFVLKGGLVFYAPQFPIRRPTRDIDLQVSTLPSIEAMERVFREICTLAVDSDGISFQPDSVRGEPISADFQGVRVQLKGDLSGAILDIQVDVSYGNIITPGAMPLDFPTLLQTESPHLQSYPYSTVLAEKLEAIVSLAEDNSRLKDYFDLWLLSQHIHFEGSVLCQAVKNTFDNRGTPLPTDTPHGLTDLFAQENLLNWAALFKRYRINMPSGAPITAVVLILRAFLLAPLHAAAANTPFTDHWSPGGPWLA